MRILVFTVHKPVSKELDEQELGGGSRYATNTVWVYAKLSKEMTGSSTSLPAAVHGECTDPDTLSHWWCSHCPRPFATLER